MSEINEQDLAREAYNMAILETALTCQEENGVLSADEELDAQIALVQATTGKAADPMVDHLREMLVISYLGEEDMPGEAPAARAEAVAPEEGSPLEVFEFTVKMTRAEIGVAYRFLEGVYEHGSDRAESRAAGTLLGALPL